MPSWSMPDVLKYSGIQQAWGDLVVSLKDLDYLTDRTVSAGKHVIAMLDQTLLGKFGLAGTLAPAVAAVDGLTGRLDSLLEPVVAYHYTPDGTNDFDPTAHAFNSLAREMTGLLTPVIDGIVETRVTAGILSPLELHTSYTTDGVSGLLHTSLTTLLPELLNGDPLMSAHGLPDSELMHQALFTPQLTWLGDDNMSSLARLPHGEPADAYPLAAQTLESAHLSGPASGLLSATAAGDLLHVGLVTPITSTGEGAGAPASAAPLSHVLHGLL